MFGLQIIAKAYSDQNTEINGASKEVLRYREALWSGYNYLKKHVYFDVEYFIKVFQEIKQTKEEIRPDFLNTTIKQGSSGPTAGQVVYTPPKGQAIIKEKLDNLVTFLNDDENFKIDYLFKVAIAHFQFEAIHAFRDGNAGQAGSLI